MKFYFLPLSYLEPLIETVSVRYGVPVDQADFAVSMVLGVFVSLLMRLTMHKIPLKYRHFYSLALGIQMLYFSYKFGFLHLLADGVGVYLIMRFLPHSYSCAVAITYSIGYLMVMHLYKMITSYMVWTPDVTAALMVGTIKYTSFAMCVADAFDEKEKGKKLDSRQTNYKIEDFPDIIEYLGWLFFFPGVLGGPAIEFMDYRRYVDGTILKSTKDGKLPYCHKDTAICLVEGSICMVITAVCPPWGIECVRRNLSNLEVAATIPFWKRWVILYRGAFIKRCIYYVGWLFGEAMSRVSGAGYTGQIKDPKTGEMVDNWETSVNVMPLLFETATTMKVGVDTWNMATERWLRHYVYDRVRFHPKYGKYARYITFVASAFWHGLYPGYYIFFISAAVHREAQGSLFHFISFNHSFTHHYLSILSHSVPKKGSSLCCCLCRES